MTINICSSALHVTLGMIHWPAADSEEGGETLPPLKSTKKKRNSFLISLFFHIWWLEMQNFLCSLRSPALFNIIINIILLKNFENNTCSYILSSFYMVTTGEVNFDMKMHNFCALKSLNCRNFRGGGFASWSPHQGYALDLTGDLGGPQTPRRISPPLTKKPGSAPVDWSRAVRGNKWNGSGWCVIWSCVS